MVKRRYATVFILPNLLFLFQNINYILKKFDLTFFYILVACLVYVTSFSNLSLGESCLANLLFLFKNTIFSTIFVISLHF